MKNVIVTLCMVFFFASVQADVILIFNEGFGDNFTNIDNSDDGPGINVIDGITFANVNAEFDKNLYNTTKYYYDENDESKSYGRVYLEASSSSKKAGYIEFTVPNAGEVIIEALIGSDPPRNFSLEKKVEGNWVNVTTFTINEKGTDESLKRWLTYTVDADEPDECTLRVINAQTGQTHISSITVKEYVAPTDNYIEKNTLVHEKFDGSPWEEQPAGNYLVDISAGTVSLTNCQVNITNNAGGNAYVGRIRMENNTSSIEFPELLSCGTITMQVNAGSADKSITLEKKSLDGWVAVTTFPIGTASEEISYSVKSKEPITLRLTTNNGGAKHIYEVLITDYIKDTATAIATATGDNGAIISTRYFSITGVEMQEPASGLYIQQTTYENGFVETTKKIKGNN